MFALFAPYGLLVLIPVNLHEKSSTDERHESNINNFNRLSMSNIQHYDSRMWLHAIGMYLLSALAMYFLVVEYRQVLPLFSFFLSLLLSYFVTRRYICLPVTYFLSTNLLLKGFGGAFYLWLKGRKKPRRTLHRQTPRTSKIETWMESFRSSFRCTYIQPTYLSPTFWSRSCA